MQVVMPLLKLLLPSSLLHMLLECIFDQSGIGWSWQAVYVNRQLSNPKLLKLAEMQCY